MPHRAHACLIDTRMPHRAHACLIGLRRGVHQVWIGCTRWMARDTFGTVAIRCSRPSIEWMGPNQQSARSPNSSIARSVGAQCPHFGSSTINVSPSPSQFHLCTVAIFHSHVIVAAKLVVGSAIPSHCSFLIGDPTMGRVPNLPRESKKHAHTSRQNPN
jgi:hypothetical protein